MHDLIVQGGTIVDGTGQPSFTGDVAVTGGKISGVGSDLGRAKRTLKADGLIVAPGWVDVHTHYDGQVSWDPLLSSISVAWSVDDRDGQLRCGLCAGCTRASRRTDWHDGER